MWKERENRNGSDAWKRRAIGLTASLVLVTLMLTGLASAVNPTLAVTPSSKAAYSPYPGLQPDPELATNVSISTVNLSCGVLCAASVSGQSTTYSAIPAGISLDSGHVANPIRFVDLTHLVVPGTLQAHALPGSVNGCSQSTHTCEDPLYVSNWVVQNVTTPTYSPCHGAPTTCHQPLVSPTLANASDPYSTYGGSSGLKVIHFTLNDSTKRTGQNAAVIGLSLPQSSWPSLNPANDYVTVIYSVSSTGVCTSACVGAIGIENASGMGTAPVSFPWINSTTYGVMPAYTALAKISQGALTLHNYTLNNDTQAGYYNSTQNRDYNYSDSAAFVTPGNYAVWSAPLSDFGAGWGNYKAPGTNFSSGCSTTGALYCTTAVNLTVYLSTGSTSTAATNLTLTLWGMDISSSSVSVGPTAQSVPVYLPSKATGKNFRTWANVTEALPAQGEFGGITAYTSLSPSWGSNGWINTSGIQESWTYPATGLTNVTETALQSTTNGSGQISYSFHFDYPSSGSIAYGCTQALDSKTSAAYVTVTGAGPNIQSSDQSVTWNAKTLEPGNRTQITGGVTCTTIPAPGSGVHSSAMQLSTGVLSATNAVINETLSYTAAQFSTLVPPTCQTSGTTCCITSPTGCPSTSTQAPGSVSLETEIMDFIQTWWPWLLLILVVIAVTVAYAERGHHHRRR